MFISYGWVLFGLFGLFRLAFFLVLVLDDSFGCWYLVFVFCSLVVVDGCLVGLCLLFWLSRDRFLVLEESFCRFFV